MVLAAIFNIVLTILAVGLFIDGHHIQKKDPSAFIGFLLLSAVAMAFVVSCLVVVSS